MKAFMLELENRPGELAKIGEALGAKGINITAITGATIGNAGRLVLATADQAAAKEALQAVGYTCNETELVETRMADRPGELGRTARRLADAGVNIEAIMPMGMSAGEIQVGLVTDNSEKAREVLAASTMAR